MNRQPLLSGLLTIEGVAFIYFANNRFHRHQQSPRALPECRLYSGNLVFRHWSSSLSCCQFYPFSVITKLHKGRNKLYGIGTLHPRRVARQLCRVMGSLQPIIADRPWRCET